jgi:hypothetical protein
MERTYQMSTEETPHHADGHDGKGHAVLVAVVTTSGRWPTKGFEPCEPHQSIDVALRKALHELHIVGAENWLATVGAREINPNQSYLEQGLGGEVVIQYGPRAGGGGSHA